eukprot:scaffold23011_cov126-Isochrysis_galbana.AAC.4
MLLAGHTDVGHLGALIGAHHAEVAREHPAAGIDVAWKASARALPLERYRLARQPELAERAHRLWALVGREGGLQHPLIIDRHRPPAERLAHILELVLAHE